MGQSIAAERRRRNTNHPQVLASEEGLGVDVETKPAKMVDKLMWLWFWVVDSALAIFYFPQAFLVFLKMVARLQDLESARLYAICWHSYHIIVGTAKMSGMTLAEYSAEDPEIKEAVDELKEILDEYQ